MPTADKWKNDRNSTFSFDIAFHWKSEIYLLNPIDSPAAERGSCSASVLGRTKEANK